VISERTITEVTLPSLGPGSRILLA